MANNPSNMMSGMPPTSQPNMPGMPQYQPGVSSGSSSPMYRSPFLQPSPAPPRTPNSMGPNTPTSGNPPTPGQSQSSSSLQQLEQMVMPSSNSKNPSQQASMSPHSAMTPTSQVGSPMGPKTPQSPSMRGSGTPLSPQQWQTSRPSSQPGSGGQSQDPHTPHLQQCPQQAPTTIAANSTVPETVTPLSYPQPPSTDYLSQSVAPHPHIPNSE